MATGLPPFPSFDAENQENLAARWQRWFARFENLMVALDVEDDKRKRALLLHYMDESTLDIFETLADTGTADDYNKACDALNKQFTPQKNTSFEVYKFRNTKQRVDETLDQYHVRLVQLSKYCEFEKPDKEIKAQIELGTMSKQLRRHAFRNPKLTLSELLAFGRTQEITESDAKGIEHDFKRDVKVQDVQQVQGRPQTVRKRKCFKCGYSWPHLAACPAKGKTCNKCKGYNHFARCCKSKPSTKEFGEKPTKETEDKSQTSVQGRHHRVKQVEAAESPSSSDSDEYVYTIQGNTVCTDMKLTSVSDQSNSINSVTVKHDFYTTVKVDDFSVRMNIDSGASVNIIDSEVFQKLKGRKDVKLSKTKNKLFGYGSKTPLDVQGCFEAQVESKHKISLATFYVLKGTSGCLLSGRTAIDLGLLKINSVSQEPEPSVDKPPAYITKRPPRLETLLAKHDHVFRGIGKLKNYKLHLHIDKSVPPVIQQPRRIPFAMRAKLSKELQRLEDMGIIEDVQGPTTWASPIVCFPKPNNPEEIRMCIDMRVPNKAILRERHPSPTIDDLIQQLNGSSYFSKLDLSSGYHQLELDEESRDITTFVTHKGLKRFTRLNFGTNSASEIFQNVIQTTFQDIEGCLNVSDDILVFAKTQEEHDKILQAVLERADEMNLRFNGRKCEFDKRNLTFYGHVFSEKGVSACPKKIKAIQAMTPPSNVSELRSYLGMVNYCGRFIKDLATVTAPLRQLTKKHVTFEWKPCHQEAFEKLQSLLTEKKVMSYFDLSKHTELIVDASPTGLGAILLQSTPGKDDSRVIAYASRALTEVEQRYSQTEREALAIVFGCEHFRLYLYGIHFTLYTDHKPLELIFGNLNSKPPARLERWRLRLQSYDFEVKYRPGHDNPSDYMSRHPIQRSKPPRESANSEQYVQFIAESAAPKAIMLEDIKMATLEDATLQEAIRIIRGNRWHKIDEIENPDVDKDELKMLRNVKDELTVSSQNDVLLRNTRIVIPRKLRSNAISLAHIGHQGLVKTKSLLREKVWFPLIDSLVKKEIDSCIPCQASGREKPPQPLCMSSLPEENFEKVYVDFLGPLPSGESLLVVLDGRSRYPVVEIQKKTDAPALIPRLDKIFALFGIPKEVVSDNGPPFKGYEIKKFMRANGIYHRRITPLWPQINEAETFMKPLMRAIETAHVENRNWRRELQKFLLSFRATPHSTTKVAPATVMFARNIRTKLPQIEVKVDKSAVDKKIEQQDKDSRQKMKEYADKRRNATATTMKIGDCVLVKQKRKNKLSTRFDPRSLRVTKIKGTMVTAQRNNFTITRNQSFFKLVDDARLQSDGEEDVDEDYQTDGNEQIEDENRNDDTVRQGQNPIARYPVRDRRRPQYYHDEYNFRR